MTPGDVGSRAMSAYDRAHLAAAHLACSPGVPTWPPLAEWRGPGRTFTADTAEDHRFARDL